MPEGKIVVPLEFSMVQINRSWEGDSDSVSYTPDVGYRVVSWGYADITEIGLGYRIGSAFVDTDGAFHARVDTPSGGGEFRWYLTLIKV